MFTFKQVGGNFLRTNLNDIKTLFHFAVVLNFLLLLGCDQAKNLDTSSDQEQIKEHFKNWVKVSEQGDVNGYFDFISDDFVYIGTPDTAPIHDHDSLRSFLTMFFTDNTFSLPKWETHEVLIRSNIAIHRLSGVVYFWPKNDTTNVSEEDRTYLDILKKDENGNWKTYLHSYEINERTTTNKK